MSTDTPKKLERATDMEWLAFFYDNADFGPAHEDVVNSIREHFMRVTGKDMPFGYGDDE